MSENIGIANEQFGFFSETISQHCLLGNVVSLHGYMAAAYCQPKVNSTMAWMEAIFPTSEQNHIDLGDANLSAEFETLLLHFYQGIQEDIEQSMFNPKFFFELLDCDMQEATGLWVDGFVYGARLRSLGFLDEPDEQILELIFPILIQQESPVLESIMKEPPLEISLDDVRVDAFNHIGDNLRKLRMYLRG
jgi:yecA family protein